MSYGYTSAARCTISTGMRLEPRHNIPELDLVSLLLTVPGLGSFVFWFGDVFNIFVICYV